MADHILVVDDEPDVRQLFKITLSMSGYRADVARDGLEAMTAIDKEPPSLVLLDLMMPRLDGFGVIDRLREQQPNGGLKVLIATAKSLDEKERERLKGWPVVGVLNKGELDLMKLVSLVQTALSQQPKPEEAPAETIKSNGKPAADSSPATAKSAADATRVGKSIPVKKKEGVSDQA